MTQRLTHQPQAHGRPQNVFPEQEINQIFKNFAASRRFPPKLSVFIGMCVQNYPTCSLYAPLKRNKVDIHRIYNARLFSTAFLEH